MNQAHRPDLERVRSSLKDFQLDTVDYVFRRLYLDEDYTRRFLLADEVGLGKTMVARGVIAHAVDLMWDSVNRIDVVYICSNADIARQNINRLNFTKTDGFEFASRLTLLPSEIHDLKANKLNFISFTPGTSFNLRSSLGRARERMLLYHLLAGFWEMERAGPYNVLQGDVQDFRDFRRRVHEFRKKAEIDESLAAAFRNALARQIRRERQKGIPTIEDRFNALCDDMQYARKEPSNYPYEVRTRRSRFIGELRSMVAEACIEALEPDLIVLDEFQRFRHLLSADDEAGMLAQRLFDYSDEDSQARLLLLSATPYKMYTTSGEVEDDHYEDFIGTVAFLENDSDTTERTRAAIKTYRRELFRANGGNARTLREAARSVEERLQRVMVRTERLASSPNRIGMLREVRDDQPTLGVDDVKSFLTVHELTERLGAAGSLEYWKSSPYLLSFMDDYDLKRRAGSRIDSNEFRHNLDGLDLGHLTLRSENIETYRKIDPGNARLRSLLEATIEMGWWRLLWMPPSMPYYDLESPFSATSTATKRLIFSAWRVVPKMIATMVSYEAERRIFSSFEERPENTREARERRRPLLRFARSEGRLTGMPVLSIIYPSVTLVRLTDPLTERGARGGSLTDALHKAEVRIQYALDQMEIPVVDRLGHDEAWYWAAPLLLDMQYAEASTSEWFGQDDISATWSDADKDDDADSPTRWADHVQFARRMSQGHETLGPPPDDLAEVLAYAALAAPGTVALRSLARIPGASAALTSRDFRNIAGRLAWNMLKLFRTPEATAIIRGWNAEEPFWRRVLEYGAAGCLQSVIDEYVHVLSDSLGLIDETSLEAAEAIAEEIGVALSLITSSMTVDELDLDGREVRLNKLPMRAHFAARFGDEKSEDGERTRAGQLRTAFNSPFWPFVLATTSVGQEGLDFHTYCHAVVHWNLPSNPVDLEQREGRVHRYKGHAVRKNVASAHAPVLIANGSDRQGVAPDPWRSLFDLASRTRSDHLTDIVPFWVYQIPEGARIERHVPYLPLSRDAQRLERLRRALVGYRMVFGQARQDDLLEYLLAHLSEEEFEQYVADCTIDLSPPAGPQHE